MEESELPMVIINYIPDHWSDARLAEEFELFAPKKVKLIRDRLTGRSCGYGFIEFGDDDTCQKAIDAVSGREVDGKRLKVTWAKPRNEVKFNTNVYVSGLPLDTTEQQFAELCEQYGRIVEIRLLTTAASHGAHNTLAAFVRFNKRHESDAFILAAHGLPIPGFSPQTNNNSSNNNNNNDNTTGNDSSTNGNNSSSDSGKPNTSSTTNRRTWVLSARYATDNRTRYKEATGAWLTNSAVDRRANNLGGDRSGTPSSGYSNSNVPYIGNMPNNGMPMQPGGSPATSPRNGMNNNNYTQPNQNMMTNQPNSFQRFPNQGNQQNPNYSSHQQQSFRRNNNHNNGSNRNANNNGQNNQFNPNHPGSVNTYYAPPGSINHTPHPTTPYWTHPGYENPTAFQYATQPYFATSTNIPSNAPITTLPPGVTPQWNTNFAVRNPQDNNRDTNSNNWRNTNGTGNTDQNNLMNVSNNTISKETANNNNNDPTMRALDEQLRGLNINNQKQQSTNPPTNIPVLSTPSGNIALVSAPYTDPSIPQHHVLNQINGANPTTTAGNNNVAYTTYHPYSISQPANPSIPYSTAIYPGTAISEVMKTPSTNFSPDPNGTTTYFAIRNVPNNNNVNTNISNHHPSENKDGR